MDDSDGDYSNEYNWNTDDEDEVFGIPSSVPNIIQQSCGHNLLSLEDPSPGAPNRPCSSAKKIDNQLDSSDDEDSYPGSRENTLNFERDKILTVLVNMEYPIEEALIAIEKCGPEAEICDLTDFICAAQLEKEIDSHLQNLPKKKHDASVYMHKKRRDGYYFRRGKRLKLDDERKASAIDMETMQKRSSESMTGFGTRNQLYPNVARRLRHKVTAGKPYFYYENVAGAPKGVWRKISSFLFEIEPEFVDSKYFCAAARKRGYIHNLPIENRSRLLPIPPLTIQEALPTTKRWWPSWDTRIQLNCLISSIAPATVTEKIRKALEECDAKPPPTVREYVLKECRSWNLVWVGKNKVAPLEPDEYEMLLGLPKDHTRGGGISRTMRYKALGNAFQVDTVAYHLSVLKGHFPKGINVLSLFSGIGGAEVALHGLGIMLRNVVSVEVAQENRNILRSWWEQTNQQGNLIEVKDVQHVTWDQLEQWITSFGGFDLIIGGSPCNNISGSNRVSRNGLEGKHSSLFYEYYRIVEAIMHIQL
ncbi:hypothetical protein TanjilG_20735 [Lupinus angustifolius]|uniref:DNA (cytosine-5-)-methyltransferase n=1 Tax=Lupinus angustifolius TaxID=3871 RepID=A0A4P1QRM1_LUPAN|nr:hypothetical protein TanjilG_20735 [Lupinus angustifolius]